MGRKSLSSKCGNSDTVTVTLNGLSRGPSTKIAVLQTTLRVDPLVSNQRVLGFIVVNVRDLLILLCCHATSVLHTVSNGAV